VGMGVSEIRRPKQIEEMIREREQLFAGSGLNKTMLHDLAISRVGEDHPDSHIHHVAIPGKRQDHPFDRQIVTILHEGRRTPAPSRLLRADHFAHVSVGVRTLAGLVGGLKGQTGVVPAEDSHQAGAHQTPSKLRRARTNVDQKNVGE